MTDTIRFVLDGEIVSINGCDPTRTVLQYLREDCRRLGSKEGCAEGDCGACTVVIAEPNADDSTLRYQAINSCIQFLPTLDGKELITVESLGGQAGRLHPAQQAMVECHGSQCGFCTPGFVMSMFALYKSRPSVARKDIDVALSGNLCRCTGYRPIVDAAQSMYAIGRNLAADEIDRFTRPCAPADASSQPEINAAQESSDKTSDKTLDDEQTVALLHTLRRDDTLHVTDGRKQYFAPVTLNEFAELFRQHPDACILAGGTDVGLWVTKQHRDLAIILYAGNVPELRQVTVDADDLDIGAAVSLSNVLPHLLQHYPDLEEMFLRFASPPIRNAGTLGGNVANGSPIGDSMPALMVLGTQIVLRKGNKTREMPLQELYLDYMQTALEEGEFVERLRIPLPGLSDTTGSPVVRCYKLSKRFDQDISAVCGAYALTLKDNHVDKIRIAYGGMAATPKRAKLCEKALLGKPWTEETINAGMAALDKEFSPISDMRASAGYRQQTCRNLLYRFFIESNSDPGEKTIYDYAR